MWHIMMISGHHDLGTRCKFATFFGSADYLGIPHDKMSLKISKLTYIQVI